MLLFTLLIILLLLEGKNKDLSTLFTISSPAPRVVPSM